MVKLQHHGPHSVNRIEFQTDPWNKIQVTFAYLKPWNMQYGDAVLQLQLPSSLKQHNIKFYSSSKDVI